VDELESDEINVPLAIEPVVFDIDQTCASTKEVVTVPEVS
jgi:hypothetical protein